MAASESLLQSIISCDAYLKNVLMIDDRKIEKTAAAQNKMDEELFCNTDNKKLAKMKIASPVDSERDVLKDIYSAKLDSFKAKRKKTREEVLKKRKDTGLTKAEKRKLKKQQKKNNAKKAKLSTEEKELETPTEDVEPINVEMNVSTRETALKSEKRRKSQTKSLEKQLAIVQSKNEKIEKIREEKGVDAAIEKHESNISKLALARSTGLKPKDDASKLKQSIKRRERKKKKSQEEWKKRVETVEEKKAEKQQKRQSNIEARRNTKVKNKLNKMRKKGRHVDYQE